MGLDRYAPFPYRPGAEVPFRIFQIFIAQIIEWNFFIADRCALVPFQTVFHFSLITIGGSFRFPCHLAHTPALEGNVDIPAIRALLIFFTGGVSLPDRLKTHWTFSYVVKYEKLPIAL